MALTVNRERSTTFHYEDGRKIIITYEFEGFPAGPELLDRYMGELNSALMAFFNSESEWGGA